MSNIRFEQRRRKKTYLIPLLIIILLYVSIPMVLINKGSDLLRISETKIKNDTIYSPPIEFYNGQAFLNTATAFPGFAGWAENVAETSVKQMLSEHESKFKTLCSFLYKSQSVDKLPVDSFDLSFNKDKPLVLTLRTNNKDSLQVWDMSLNDSLLNVIREKYCAPWQNFFAKQKLDNSALHQFCKTNFGNN